MFLSSYLERGVGSDLKSLWSTRRSTIIARKLQPLLLHDNKTASDRKSESAFMDSSTHDKAEGRAKEGVGKVKEETGKAIGNPDLQDRGAAEKVGGKVERKVGDVKKVVGK